MRIRQHALIVVLVLVTLISTSVAYSQAQSVPRERWEYTIIEWNRMGEAGLNRLGAQGWELVSVTPDNGLTWFYFKRRL